jgi:DNA-binding IclR family transcriptional regulator
LLGDAELERLTSDTTTDRSTLESDLRRIADAGVAVTHGERVPDAVAISAPVFDASGRAAAALTISGVASRYEPERVEEDSAAVKRYAEAISTDLGREPAAEQAVASARS